MYVSLGANVSLLQADNVYEGIYLSFGGFLCGSQGIHDLIKFRENGSVAIMGRGESGGTGMIPNPLRQE